MFAHSFKKPELVERRSVVDLARRVPSNAKEKWLNYLNDRFGSAKDPTFVSLMGFVEREEDIRFIDFTDQLMADEKSELGSKSDGGGQSSGKSKKLWHNL